MNSELFLSLFLVHIIGDFYLQTDKYCRIKESKKLKSWFLYVHAATIGGLSWIVNPSCDFLLYAGLVAKTEYVLAGTFLSFGIAILCGLIANL